MHFLTSGSSPKHTNLSGTDKAIFDGDTHLIYNIMGMEWGDKAHRHTDKTGASATTSTKTEDSASAGDRRPKFK